jgi:hypothetical protein
MRKVMLPAGSGRGGVLTQGSALLVTSNPDRTFARETRTVRAREFPGNAAAATARERAGARGQ